MGQKSILDLRGTDCPMNFVRIKIALDKLGSGVSLEVRLDGGGVAEEVTRSLKDQGYRVSRIREEKGAVEIMVSRLNIC